ncbi:MAG: adenylate/guanylate cyclase domain-containing protein, partial [Chloroflexi bacterium]
MASKYGFEGNVGQHAGTPTGTVTFLFTDIEGSTRLLQELGDEWDKVLEDQRRLMRAAITANHGLELGTEGDSFFVVFTSAADATQAVVLAQQALDAHAWPGDKSVRVRMGLHSGEGRVVAADYIGLDVHRAARIAASGHGGQVIISDSVHALVQKALPPGVSIRDLGEHRLKDLPRPEHLYQLDIEGLPTEFPALKVLDVRINNLPLQLTSFVGRSAEVAEAKRLLSRAHSVTLIGPGGVGKTRLAIEVARQSVAEFPEGVWLIELASLTNASLVPQAVANSLRIREQPGVAIADTIVRYLEGRHVLLVLDNCEHLIQPVAELVETILGSCPDIRVLATSREALRVGGEAIFPVPALSVPAAVLSGRVGDLGDYEAVRLFCDRASTDVDALPTDPENSAAIVEICRHLDGVPLAIELAAATLSTLTAKQIAAKLDDRFRVLAPGRRAALPRQQTLAASIDWSYDLLSDPERSLLRRLSMFGGAFSLEAAEAVCAGQPIAEPELFGLLRSLVNKSLVNVTPIGGELRYNLLETVRQYAADHLAAGAEDTVVRARHLSWHLLLAEKASSGLHGPEQAAWLTRLDHEQADLRKALASALSRQSQTALRLAGCLVYFWLIRGHISEGREWLRLALQMPADPLARARGLTSAGILAHHQSDPTEVRELLSESVKIHEHCDDPLDKSLALTHLGIALESLGDPAAGSIALEQAVTSALKGGGTWELSVALNHLGMMRHYEGDMSAQPRTLLEDGLRAARAAGDGWYSIYVLDSLAQVALDHMDIESARRYWHECLALNRHLGETLGIPSILEGFARLASAQSEHRRAL